jgi:hypothetical protein
MDTERLDCDMTDVGFYFDNLSENATDIPAAFFFGLREPGLQNWADHRNEL